MTGIKSTLLATPPTTSHQAQAMKAGNNAAGFTAQLVEMVSELNHMLAEHIKTFGSRTHRRIIPPKQSGTIPAR